MERPLPAARPAGEIFVGVRTPCTEVVARADAILAALAEADVRVVDAEHDSEAELLAVHDAALLEFLESAWDEWARAGLDRERGQDRVVPYVFAHAALTSGRPAAAPTAVWAKTGYFAYDTMTLIGPDTWGAARCRRRGADGRRSRRRRRALRVRMLPPAGPSHVPGVLTGVPATSTTLQ